MATVLKLEKTGLFVVARKKCRQEGKCRQGKKISPGREMSPGKISLLIIFSATNIERDDCFAVLDT
jgi:hypothetical protein